LVYTEKQWAVVDPNHVFGLKVRVRDGPRLRRWRRAEASGVKAKITLKTRTHTQKTARSPKINMNKMKKNAGTVALHPTHLLPVESRFRAGLLLSGVAVSPAGMATTYA
jgi:hypothetical protein